MKASILGSILFVTLATCSPMVDSHPGTNGAAMDMSMKRGMDMDNMPSADMDMKGGMKMDMPSAGGNEPMDMGMKRGMGMGMGNMPSSNGKDHMGMGMPMEGKGEVPSMGMKGMPAESKMEDMPKGMSGENMPGMDMGMDKNKDMNKNMGMGQGKENMME